MNKIIKIKRIGSKNLGLDLELKVNPLNPSLPGLYNPATLGSPAKNNFMDVLLCMSVTFEPFEIIMSNFVGTLSTRSLFIWNSEAQSNEIMKHKLYL